MSFVLQLYGQHWEGCGCNMMIKITEKCSMGCSHCMNNATLNGKHMELETFKKAINFQKKYGGAFCIITGGEPTEHPQFVSFIVYALENLKLCYITVTTNGVWMQHNEDEIKSLYNIYGNRLMFQVTNDKRFYPTQIDLSLPVFTYDNVVVCNKLEHIYPQGRAIDNNLEWESKASKCFNVRAITHQIGFKGLGNIIAMLAVKGKFCTPHINIDGYIKLGESDLCPNCSHIDKTHDEIIDDILNFKCSKCNHINNNLPKEYRMVIGEN